jgi:hypothetical protein
LLAYGVVRWHILRGGWLPDYLLRHHPFDIRRLSSHTPVDVIVLVSNHV